MYISQTSLAIQLQDDELQLLLLGKGLKEMQVLGARRLELTMPKEPSSQEYEDTLRLHIREFVSSAKKKPDQVVLGLSRRYVHYRIIEIPKVADEEIANVLEFEAPRHFPFPAEEAYYSHLKLDSRTANMLRILLVAVKRGYLDPLLRALKQLNLYPGIVDFSSLSLVNAYYHLYNQKHDKSVALVNIDRGITDIAILGGHEFVFSRAIPTDQLWHKQSTSKPATGEFSIDPDALVQELNTIFRAARLDKEESVDEIVLTGMFADDKTTKDKIFEAIRINTVGRATSELVKVESSEYTRQVDDYGFIPVGLALRGFRQHLLNINLLPPSLRITKKNYSLIATILLSSLLVALAVLLIVGAFYKQGLILGYYEKEIARILPKVREVQELSGRSRALNQAIDTFAGLQQSITPRLDILAALSDIIPKPVWLNELRVDGNKLTIVGEAQAPETLVEKLEEHPLFQKVKMGRVERSRFTIEMEVINARYIPSPETSKLKKPPQSKMLSDIPPPEQKGSPNVDSSSEDQAPVSQPEASTSPVEASQVPMRPPEAPSTRPIDAQQEQASEEPYPDSEVRSKQEARETGQKDATNQEEAKRQQDLINILRSFADRKNQQKQGEQGTEEGPKIYGFDEQEQSE